MAASMLFYQDDGDRFFGVTEPRFLSFPEDDLVTGMTVLIVDDVWDTGLTARAVRARVERAGGIPTVCTLHYKPGESGQPEFFAQTTDKWIVYPWELLSPALSGAPC